MIPVELFTKPLAGQFWLDPRAMKLYEVVSVKPDGELMLTNEYVGSISNERGIRLPCQFILLWNMMKVSPEFFDLPSKPGQAWVNLKNGEVFVVSPIQPVDGEYITLLSTSSDTITKLQLIHDP